MCKVFRTSQQRNFDNLRLKALGGACRSQKYRSYKSPSGRDFLETKVGDATTLALYDTGSDVTLLHTQVFEQIREFVIGTIDPVAPRLSQACGAPVKDVKSCTLRLFIGDQAKDVAVFVCPSVAHDMILGKPEIDEFQISYDARVGERRLVFPGEARVRPKTAVVLKPGETAMVECEIASLNRNDRLGPRFTIESDQWEDQTDLYINPVLVSDHKEGDSVHIPVTNLSVADIDLKTVDIMESIGTATRAPTAIPLSAFKIGELEMPELTDCPMDKVKYLMENLQIGPELPKSRHGEFKDLIIKYHQAFGAHEFDLGKTETYVHDIKLTDSKPVFNKQFPLSEHSIRFLREHIKEMVRIGILENSQSQWNSCCFVVPKPSGGYRMVIDLRSVNAKTIPAIHNGATVDEIIKRLANIRLRMVSSCDILKGFWQVPLDPKSREFTSFNIPTIGSYRYTVAPMGASGSCYAFWTLMSAVTHGLTNTLAYLDDLLTASSSVDDHLEHLEQLFRRMIMHRLTLGVPKCSFFQAETDFLGFTISKEGVKPAPPKMEVVKLIDPPSTVREIKAFLGLAQYFGHHFPFQREAKHLSSLTRQDSEWKKGELPPRAKLAFERIKEMLVRRPLLSYPDYTKEFLLFTDAATGQAGPGKDGKRTVGGVGAFLAQVNDDGKLVALGYAGRGLKSHENNYSAYLLELAAAVYGLDKFHTIIDKFPTRLFTDHQPLTAFSNPLSEVHTKTWRRLTDELVHRNVKLQYHPGLLNGVADTLSRIDYSKAADHEPEEHPVLAAIEDQGQFERNRNEAVAMFVPVWNHTADEIARMQDEDPLLKQVKAHLRRTERSMDPAVLQAARMSVVTRQNILFQRQGGRKPKKARYLIHAPEQMIPEILYHGHDHAMGGAHRRKGNTVDRIRTLFTWDRMVQDVSDYVDSCHVCQTKGKALKNEGKLVPMPVERFFNARVHMDLFGDIQPDKYGYKYVLVMACAFSRYAVFVPIRNKDAVTVAKAFRDRWVCQYGAPLEATSDNGGEFASDVLKAYEALAGIEHHYTTAYHPQANGKCERINPAITEYLRSYVDWRRDDWSEGLAEINFSYNTSLHQGIKTTPFEAVHPLVEVRFPGFDPLPGMRERFYGEDDASDLLRQTALTREYVAAQSERYQAQWNKRMNKFRTDPTYKKGDPVLLYSPARDAARRKVKGKKLINPWVGPCKVTQFKPPCTVDVWVPPGPDQIKGRVQRAHVQLIKPYIDRSKCRWVRGDDLPDPTKTEDELRQEHDQYMKSLEQDREAARELEYGGETTIGEALDFLDDPLDTTPGDSVEWPGESGSPIPQVTVEDPGMCPNTVPRQGAQGHLVNPHGTPVRKYREETTPLTPDRVVIRVAPKRPKGRPRKGVAVNRNKEQNPPVEGPARNTRSRAATNRMVEETIKGLYPDKRALRIHGLPNHLQISSISFIQDQIHRNVSRRGVMALYWGATDPPPAGG